MKKLVIIFAVISLSGCMYQSVNNIDLRKALHACNGVENIEHITSRFDGSELVKCTNRQQSELLSDVVLP